MKRDRPLLTIQIPTVEGREEQYEELKDEIFRQGEEMGLFKSGELGLVKLKDNKEMTIGKKRTILYQEAMGLYSVQVDDDDMIHKDFMMLVFGAIDQHPDVDCITYKELCIFDGRRVESSNHSMKYKSWADNFDGYNHVRTPFFKNVIKTELCRKAQIPDIRFGEDHEFAKNIYPLIKTEYHIDEFLYIYRHNSTPFNERYGIVPKGN